MFDNPFIHGSVLFRRDVVGAYDPAFESAEDFDLWSRVAAHHLTANLPERLVDHRVHSASMAAGFDADHAARVHVIIERNLREVLGLDDLPADPIDLIGALWRRYPERDNPDVATAAAVKFGDIALALATRDRKAAVRAFAHAMRRDTRTAIAFASRFVP